MEILDLHWVAVLCYSIKFFSAFTIATLICSFIAIPVVAVVAIVTGVAKEILK